MAPRASAFGVRKGDGGTVEHRRAKVRCTHIAIIRAVASNARYRPIGDVRQSWEATSTFKLGRPRGPSL
jgi:hypothetical protein